MRLDGRTMRPKVGLALMLATLAIPGFAASQQASPTQYEVSGEALPKYYVIQEFLRDGFKVREKSLDKEKAGSRSRFDQFLSEIGLRHDGGNEDVAIVAFQTAAIELQERTFDLSLLDQPEAFSADQHDRLNARARRIGEIYGEFLALYLESGMAPEKVAAIDKSIDAKYRPRVSLHWMGEPDLSYLDRQQEFEMGVSRNYNTESLTDWNVSRGGIEK